MSERILENNSKVYTAIKHLFEQNDVATFGIIHPDMFKDAPSGHHPLDIFPNAKSVIVFGMKHLTGTYHASSAEPYSFIRNELNAKISQTSMALAYLLESYNYSSIAINSIGPTSQDENGRSRGIISLKHAAVLAGLGSFGKNTLVLNKDYGNLLWFGAVISTAPLVSTDKRHDDICIKSCTKCIDACQVNALSLTSSLMDQNKCWHYAFDTSDEKLQITCFACRNACPIKFGVNKS